MQKVPDVIAEGVVEETGKRHRAFPRKIRYHRAPTVHWLVENSIEVATKDRGNRWIDLIRNIIKKSAIRSIYTSHERKNHLRENDQNHQTVTRLRKDTDEIEWYNHRICGYQEKRHASNRKTKTKIDTQQMKHNETLEDKENRVRQAKTEATVRRPLVWTNPSGHLYLETKEWT